MGSALILHVESWQRFWYSDFEIKNGTPTIRCTTSSPHIHGNEIKLKYTSSSLLGSYRLATSALPPGTTPVQQLYYFFSTLCLFTIFHSRTYTLPEYLLPPLFSTLLVYTLYSLAYNFLITFIHL